MSSTGSSLKHGLYLKNAPHSIGELATPKHAKEHAVVAERAGWDGVFMADALGGPGRSYVDPWITLASIAAETDDITLGSWITPLPRRQPWQLASELAALDRLSDGRVLLGVGLGAPWNYEVTGIGYDPASLADRYDEALEIITSLWSGEPVTYDGEHYHLDELTLATTPLQEPRIPIVMGFWWPNKRPIHRAAAYDGIMPVAPSFYGAEGVQGERPTGTPEEELAQLVEYYRTEAGGSGEIVLPIDAAETPPDFVELCESHGVTWTLTTDLLEGDSHDANLERILEGPP